MNEEIEFVTLIELRSLRHFAAMCHVHVVVYAEGVQWNVTRDAEGTTWISVRGWTCGVGFFDTLSTRSCPYPQNKTSIIRRCTFWYFTFIKVDVDNADFLV